MILFAERAHSCHYAVYPLSIEKYSESIASSLRKQINVYIVLETIWIDKVTNDWAVFSVFRQVFDTTNKVLLLRHRDDDCTW